MIQSPATQPILMQVAGSRDAGQEIAGAQSGAHATFELAIAAMFQLPANEQAQTRSGSAHSRGTTDLGSNARHRGAADTSNDKKLQAKPGSEAQAAQGLDPRLASQQQVMEAQQRLMRSADVADRAAAELRGEMDHASQSDHGEHAEFAPANAAGTIDKDGSSRTPSNETTSQHARGSAASHANTAASNEPAAKAALTSAQTADRATTHATHAASSQHQSGGSKQGDGDARHQPNASMHAQAVDRGNTSTNARSGVAPAGNASATPSANAPTSASAPGAAGPGSLATVRDPLRAFTARPASKAAQPPADQATLPNQVARGLAAAVRQRDGTLTLRLSPDFLGDIKIQVRVESGHVSAHIHAQTDQARQLLTESASTLRTALEAHGLVVERIEVAPAERHATMDAAIAHPAPIAENRAQGGALSDPDQPPPHGFGDGAPPEHRDAQGHDTGLGSRDSADESHDGDAFLDLTQPSAGFDLAEVNGRWVVRVDLVA